MGALVGINGTGIDNTSGLTLSFTTARDIQAGELVVVAGGWEADGNDQWASCTVGSLPLRASDQAYRIPGFQHKTTCWAQVAMTAISAGATVTYTMGPGVTTSTWRSGVCFSVAGGRSGQQRGAPSAVGSTDSDVPDFIIDTTGKPERVGSDLMLIVPFVNTAVGGTAITPRSASGGPLLQEIWHTPSGNSNFGVYGLGYGPPSFYTVGWTLPVTTPCAYMGVFYLSGTNPTQGSRPRMIGRR